MWFGNPYIHEEVIACGINKRCKDREIHVKIKREIFEIENDKEGIKEYVDMHFDLKKKKDINNRLEFWKLNPNIRGKSSF